MKSRSRSIFEKSISAILSAIELYNKPDFHYREESFSILAVNAWELLLKARLLQLSSNSLVSITKYKKSITKSGRLSKRPVKQKNRTGNAQTISIFSAYDKLINEYSESIDPNVRQNLEALVEIRDNSVHFINKGLDFEREILEIGTATLSNYVRISRQWFGTDLSNYNIFLMPIAFIREIPQPEGIILNQEERRLAEYLEKLHESDGTTNGDFQARMSIEIKMKRSKDEGSVKFSLSNDPDAIPVKLEEADFREKYPWSYALLTSQLKKKLGESFKVNQQYHKVRRELEKEEKYCITRLLDPANPKSLKQKFYNPNIIKEFEKKY